MQGDAFGSRDLEPCTKTLLLLLVLMQRISSSAYSALSDSLGGALYGSVWRTIEKLT